MGLRVVAIGTILFLPSSLARSAESAFPLDTGADKKALCEKLGAEKWIDFKETKDIVKDIKDATGGLGPHATLVTAANV